MKITQIRRLSILLIFLAAAVGISFAQPAATAEVRVNVTPSEAYIFVDGQPFTHRSHTLKLAPGEYTIGVYNYGYEPQVQKVTLVAGKNPLIEARLKAIPEMVNGPWGRIQIEGNVNDKAAVFLNGTKPEYFVGHVDEMNNSIMLKQRLVVPVGTYTMYLVNPKENQPFWSGQVEVKANERVIVDVAPHENYQKSVPWVSAQKTEELKRFEAGTATATIAVAPVKAGIALNKTQVNCNEPVRLTWHSKDAAEVFITANGQPMGTLPLNGEQTLQPILTTTYELKATGPGGIVTDSTTVNVNTTVHTSLTAFPAEIKYRKLGDQVLEHGSATLNWTAVNADRVRIDPIGPVFGTEGNVPLTLFPNQIAVGPIDEVKTYTITATNVCGGSDTNTASVHITGAIEAEPVVELPKTASPLPLLGLLGFGSLAAGFILRKIRMNHWNG